MLQESEYNTLLKNLSQAIMANIDKLAEIIVDTILTAIKSKINFIINAILQGYVNDDGSSCILEDLIDTSDQFRKIKKIPIINHTF